MLSTRKKDEIVSARVKAILNSPTDALLLAKAIRAKRNHPHEVSQFKVSKDINERLKS